MQGEATDVLAVNTMTNSEKAIYLSRAELKWITAPRGEVLQQIEFSKNTWSEQWKKSNEQANAKNVWTFILN